MPCPAQTVNAATSIPPSTVASSEPSGLTDEIPDGPNNRRPFPSHAMPRVPATAGTLGTLSFSSSLGLSGTSIFDIDATSQQSDLAAVAGSLNLGGVLTVSNLSGILALGNSFNLFDAAAFTGSFSGYNLPTLDPGLQWNTNNLAVDGTLSVVPEPSSALCLLGGLGALFVRRRRR